MFQFINKFTKPTYGLTFTEYKLLRSNVYSISKLKPKIYSYHTPFRSLIEKADVAMLTFTNIASV